MTTTRGVILFLSVFSLIMPANLLAGSTATLTVTATILPGESSISVDTNTVNFGTVTGSADNHRFVAGPVKVKYFAGTFPWTVRVYTANPGNINGLIGITDPNSNIPLKVWCDNYGPRLNILGHAPDEENNYFWSGYDFNGDGDRADMITNGSISEIALGFDVNGDGDKLDTGLGTASAPVSEEPVWLRIPDIAEMIAGQPYTWRRLTYAGAVLEYTGFPVFFAIDVAGVLPQDYRTITLTFQIINE